MKDYVNVNITYKYKRRNVDQGSTWLTCPFDPPLVLYAKYTYKYTTVGDLVESIVQV
jgi:hypothetical protein